MEIVVTHNNMDFDALASQFAVTKLNPAVKMVLGYPLVGNVREFLALYRSSLPIAQAKYVDLRQVTHIYVVDCQHLDRLDGTVRSFLSDCDDWPEITVFDHHERDPGALSRLATKDSIIKQAGAATTLVVDQLRKKKTKLTPFEATVLALGIYEDTGCLTYRGTTREDARCVAYLLECGADLEQVNSFIRPKLSEAQTLLLEDLVTSCEINTYEGAKVVTASGATHAYIDGLAALTRKLLEIVSAQAAFCAVHMKDRVHLVGRSESRAIDVAEVVRQFGGDGHPGAASAVIKDKQQTVESVLDTVQHSLSSRVKPQPTAGEIMASPVTTIRSSMSMDEASRLMIRHGVDGLIVSDDDELTGVVSRRDIDQAMHHKLGHAPVQGFMSKPVISAAVDTPLNEIQRLMVTEDIGRLPVLNDRGDLVGLVSRQDVLATLYGAAHSDFPGYLTGGESADEIKSFLPKSRKSRIRHEDLKRKFEGLDLSVRWLCDTIGNVAAQNGMVAYAVGGFVRDLVLNRKNFDLDFVVESSATQKSALDLAKLLECEYPGRIEVVATHERFQTATLYFHAEERKEVDLSTARTEYYEFPAALPTVEPSRLEQDLFRRDFTINTLALCLNPGRAGELVDHFDGLADIKRKIIRILHPFSFIEDPTRIVRAARFAARLGFHLEPKTRDRAIKAVNMGIFNDLGGVRLRDEIRLILDSEHRLAALDLLESVGGCLTFLDSKLEYSRKTKTLVRRAERMFERYDVEDQWIVYLGLLLSGLPPARVDAVTERLHLSNNHKDAIKEALTLAGSISGSHRGWKRSEIYNAFKGKQNESLAIAACLAAPGTRVRRIILLYLKELHDVEVILSGRDLVEMGIPQGPQLGALLEELLSARLDGEVETREDEKRYVAKRAESLSPGK